MTNINDSVVLQKNIMRMGQSNMFDRFDYFLIQKWSGINCKIEFEEISDDELAVLRKRAYRNFNKAVKGTGVGNSRTVRKWFGLDNYLAPKREMMFRIAFAVGLTSEETEEYFVKGLLKPSFQINDYQEIIYLYGLDNNLSYEYCNKMIEIFESRMSYNIEYHQEEHTEKLYNMYMEKCNCVPEEFLEFMLDNEDMFKGYSKTTLNYFEHIVEEIKECISRDAKKYLEDIMAANGFRDWRNNDGQSDDIRFSAPKFIKTIHNKKLYESMRKAYNEAYGESRNTHIIREIYVTGKVNDEKSRAGIHMIKELTDKSFIFMTDKYLSNILSVANQKAYYAKLRFGIGKLSTMNDDDRCPSEFIDLCIVHGNLVDEDSTVAKVRPILENSLTNQRQRCKLIGREDILPLVHYLSQRKYIQLIQTEGCGYQQEEARNYFVNLANNVLTGCGMEPVSDKYKLDYLLLISFESDDMYSLNDMVDLAGLGNNDE